MRVKLSTGERVMLAVTAVLLALMGGYFAGTGRLLPAQAAPGESPAGESASPGAEVSGSPAEETDAPTEETPGDTALVDINTAGLEELMSLPGVGEKRAQAILDYRAEHGPFRYVEDLIRVEGIGEGLLEGILEYAVVGGDSHAENSGGG